MGSASMAAERSTRRTAGKRALIPASVSPDGPAPAARTKAGHPSGLLTAGMRRGGSAASEPETTQQPTPGRQMVDFDPWAVLLEQLMEVPGEEPTARARPKAGSTIGPTRPKKEKER